MKLPLNKRQRFLIYNAILEELLLNGDNINVDEFLKTTKFPELENYKFNTIEKIYDKVTIFDAIVNYDFDFEILKDLKLILGEGKKSFYKAWFKEKRISKKTLLELLNSDKYPKLNFLELIEDNEIEYSEIDLS